MMKRAVKSILEATGFELRRVNYKFEPRKENRFNWIRNLDIQTVLDVGANTGQFAAKFTRSCRMRQCYELLVEKMRHVPKFRAHGTKAKFFTSANWSSVKN
jgi:hypothetical protein